MRIDGNGRIGASRDASSPARPSPAGERFSLELEQGTPEAAATRSAPVIGGLDAMLALQMVEDPLGRRRRAMRRGHRLLDVLDGMKIAMLDGTLSAADAARLGALVKEQREAAGDPGLDALLDDIDLRAQVELAKLERRKSAA